MTHFDGHFDISSSYPLTLSDRVYYSFHFYTKNPLPENSQIDVTFPVTPVASSYCYSHIGLEDISES